MVTRAVCDADHCNENIEHGHSYWLERGGPGKYAKTIFTGPTFRDTLEVDATLAVLTNLARARSAGTAPASSEQPGCCEAGTRGAMVTATPDLLDELLTKQACRRTGVRQDTWLRVDDEWSQAVKPKVWCLACGDPICSAHAQPADRALAALDHKVGHGDAILAEQQRAFQALDPLDQMFTMPATARELEIEMAL